MPDYTPDYFIAKFTAIDDHLWTTREFTYCGKHCALGHCGSIDDHEEIHTEEGKALIELFKVAFDGERRCRVADINDTPGTKFNQPTPKARILAALHYIKEKQCPPSP